ncbi:MAG: HEPN domain-containing protein [Isosphaeraceae bacterium]
MAIVNTLSKCLDSPYLFIDEDAPQRVGTLLSKAGDRLEAAANILNSGQGDAADATFLSYEAMFSCVRALVYAKGYREAGLRCLLLACETLYVKTGEIDAQHIHDFERAQTLRIPPNEALLAASKFVKRALELLTASPAKSA